MAAIRYCLIYFVAIIDIVGSISASSYILPCNRDVFCKGNILDIVQMSKAFGDGKNFVDMPMKDNPDKIVPLLTAKLKTNSTKEQIQQVVRQYFLEPGQELQNHKTPDWTESPSILKKIKDPFLQNFAQEINNRWKILTRIISQDVRKYPQRYSLIYSAKPFVVPGGRFREFYYWDTYWVIQGLLLCDMKDTVKGMLENFIDLVKTYGFIPNGGRIYYANRSQPPFLTLMVLEYWRATNDTAFLRQSLPYLVREYKFWMAHRRINLGPGQGFTKSHILNQYSTPMGYPRPESYWNDAETAEAALLHNISAKRELYSHIASAAESGWDFSSRWFALSGKNAMTLKSMKTRKIVPVGLNSILCKVEMALAEFYGIIGNKTAGFKYSAALNQRKAAVDAVFWNEESSQWLDYDMELQQQRKPFYVSNIYPMWAGCHDKNKTRAASVIKSLKKLGVLNYRAGVPTSLNKTGEQWDFPNAWPPLQEIMEAALRESGASEGRTLAFSLAKKWLETNYIAWKQTGHMYEKYDVNIKGKPGHGGEYNVQVGFGWTNGVVLNFLNRYGMNMTAPVMRGAASTVVVQVNLVLAALSISFMCFCL